MKDLAVIQRRIYEIRGQKVILDRDLAALYQVETKVLNQAVKRNIERFPEDFMFQLTEEEFNQWKSQFVTSNLISEEELNAIKMGLRRRPFAFTEQGIAMLSGILHSSIAIQMNINIMRAFVAMRQTIAALASTESKIELLNERVERLNMYIEDILRDQNDINEEQRAINQETSMQLELINISLTELQAKPKEQSRRRIGFDFTNDKEHPAAKV